MLKSTSSGGNYSGGGWEVYHTIYSSVTGIGKPIHQQEEWRQQINYITRTISPLLHWFNIDCSNFGQIVPSLSLNNSAAILESVN